MAGIITGAALIMVAVFAGMAGGQLMMFQQMGWLPRLNIEGTREARDVPEPTVDAAPVGLRREHVPVTPVYGAVNRGVAINPGRPEA